VTETTVVMVPRERFSAMLESVQSILDSLSPRTRFIVLAGQTPTEVMGPLRNLQKRGGFELVETDGVLLAPRARNLARSLVDTKYTCFVDNDLFVQPGWLEALEANANRNSAAAVAPLTLIGPAKDVEIHHAGSELSVFEDQMGRVRLKSIHRLDGVPLREAEANDFYGIPETADEFEYHCALLQTDVIHEMGGHDERQTKHDHLNDSLRIKMLGHKITFERDARVMYQAFRKFEDFDWPFFFYRWSYESSSLSDRCIGDCWGARKNYEDTELDFVKQHHQRACSTQLPRWTKKVRPRRVRDKVARMYAARFARNYMIPTDLVDPHVPPAPPANGLELAGITGAELIAAKAGGAPAHGWAIA
jgi:hypothetical protein